MFGLIGEDGSSIVVTRVPFCGNKSPPCLREGGLNPCLLSDKLGLSVVLNKFMKVLFQLCKEVLLLLATIL